MNTDGNEDVKVDENVEIEIETEATAETETNSEIDNAEDNVEVLDSQEKQEDDFKEKYYYLAAEMDNLRKRFDREKEGLLKFGSEKILGSLIEVVDNLDRTIDATSGETDEKVVKIVEGIEMVRKQFLDVLKNNGLERVEALGKTFDPNFHEALSQVADDTKQDEEIVQEYQKGYVLNGRLLRAAKVVIAKN
ncbi:MAG: nucleotide exchange factor GrpE [Oligoflexia bacterium]|nr:nucleotide exchange factor GrpE [Oligoflexia bacterium]